jgi:LacI family transcriptional regulator
MPAIAAATDFVLRKGHKRIGIVTPYDPFNFFVKQRYQALYAASLASAIKISHFKLEENSRRCALKLGLEIAAMPAHERPTVLFLHNDHLAIGVYHGVRRAGLSVPKDISIIGVDGIEEADCLDLPLSTIQSPVDELCRTAVSMLVERIEERVDCAPRHVTVESKLVLKGTT